jgi:hypothetical protein
MTYIKMHKFRDALAACEQALPIQQALPEDKYDLGRIRFCIALSLESVHGDHARAIALTTQANDDFEKAQAGEGLKFYRDATARFLRAAAKD